MALYRLLLIDDNQSFLDFIKYKLENENFRVTPLPMIFRGSGDCTEVLWRFLGLSISEWALVWFLIFVIAGLYAATKKPIIG